MTKPSDLSIEDGLELSLDALDQWESELDDFSNTIQQRLRDLTGTTPQQEEPTHEDSIGDER